MLQPHPPGQVGQVRLRLRNRNWSRCWHRHSQKYSRHWSKFKLIRAGRLLLLGGEPEDAERGDRDHGGRLQAVPGFRYGVDAAQVADAAAAVYGRVGVDDLTPP